MAVIVLSKPADRAMAKRLIDLAPDFAVITMGPPDPRYLAARRDASHLLARCGGGARS